MAATLTEREILVARAFFRRYKPAGIPVCLPAHSPNAPAHCPILSRIQAHQSDRNAQPDTWTEIAHESKISNGNIGRNAKFAFNSLMAKLGGGGDGSDADGGDSAASNGTLTPTKKGAAGAAKPKGVTKPKSPAKGKKGKGW